MPKFQYLQSKKLGKRGHVHKSKRERALSQEQFEATLQACEDSQKEFNECWHRDYCAIYLGFMLGLRIGEVALLERTHFRDFTDGGDTAFLPTLKQSTRIPYRCKGETKDEKPCGRAVRLRWDMAGKEHTCSKCGTTGIVQKAKDTPVTGVVEKDPGFVEAATIKYVLDYLEHAMRADQKYLFESKFKGYHISESFLSRIFNTFAARAKIDGKPCISSKYSWHSLRHGRGVTMYSISQNLEAVREALRHKNLKTAEIYIGLDAELRQQYQKKLERRAFDPLKKWKPKKKPAEKGN